MNSRSSHAKALDYLAAIVALIVAYCFLAFAVWLLIAAVTVACLARRDDWLRHSNNIIGIWRGHPEGVIDTEVAEILRRLRKLSHIQSRGTPQAQAALKTRTGLTDHQLWLLAVDAILSRTNDNDCHSLDLGIHDEAEKDMRRESLGEWWGIHNRSDLFGMLEQMKVSNHSGEYLHNLATWTGPVEKLRACMETKGKLRTDLQLIGHTREYILDRALYAWDYGRCIMLCKVGYAVGYLSITEAWNFIEEFGAKLEGRYKSWQDYGLNYIIGRTIWGSDKMRVFNGACESYTLLFESDGAFSLVPWPKQKTATAANSAN